MTSMASISGIPARTNAESCREKCISSSCFNFFFVSSNWRTLVFSFRRRTSNPCSTRAAIADLTEVASVTPRTRFPPSVVARYLNFTVVPSHRVDVPKDLGDGRDVVRHQLDPAVAKGPHPLSHGELVDLLVIGLPGEQLPHLLREKKQL